ncbi:hypothetical protein C0J52_01707 [Blattella germanica]|nr:hypothetical protein C0J52_01707 [Blattella germanica]
MVPQGRVRVRFPARVPFPRLIPCTVSTARAVWGHCRSAERQPQATTKTGQAPSVAEEAAEAVEWTVALEITRTLVVAASDGVGDSTAPAADGLLLDAAGGSSQFPSRLSVLLVQGTCVQYEKRAQLMNFNIQEWCKIPR